MWQKLSRVGPAGQLAGQIPVHHRYTAGVAGERFFRTLRDDGTLLASRCPGCGDAFLPPALYCERCFLRTNEWVLVDGPGYVKAFTVLHRSLEEEPLAKPTLVALIGWDGVRGGILHRLGEVEPEQVTTGLRVEPALAPRRTGCMEDIQYFKPVTGN